MSSFLVQLGDNFTFGGEVVFQCPKGFLLEGSATLKCLWNGSWNGPVPSCRPRRCDRPTVPRHASVVSLNQTFGGGAEFRCQAGYQALDGDALVKCGPDGLWLQRKALDCQRKLKSLLVGKALHFHNSKSTFFKCSLKPKSSFIELPDVRSFNAC